jgi:two-component system, sensor histidine kinase and response regulator
MVAVMNPGNPNDTPELSRNAAMQTRLQELEEANTHLHQRLDALTQELDQHRQLESELNRERTQLRTLIDRLPDHIYFKDAQGRIVTCNRAEAQHQGKTPQDLIGKTDFDFYPTELAAQFATDERALMESGQPLIDHEEPNLDATGNPRWYSTTKVPLRDDSGATIGLVGITRDITERKLSAAAQKKAQEMAEAANRELAQANEKMAQVNAALEHEILERQRIDEELARDRNLLRALIDALPDHIYFKDTQGRIVTCNQAEAQHQGKTPEDLRGKTDFDFYPPQLAAQFAADERALMDSGQALVNHEEPNLDLAGNQRWYSTTKVPFQDAAGKVNGLVGITRDITARKQAEEALRQAKDAAETANRAKSEFLANMSHEIRTPMNAVIGMSNLLLDTPLNPEQLEFVNTIRTGGETLLTIINDILDFSKIEAGKLLFETVDFDLHEMVEYSVDLVAERAQAKGIELTYFMAPETTRGLRGDPGRLRQVLLNLLSNAVKFTTQGEIALEISQTSQTETQVELRFTLRDTGIGISPEAQLRLFQPFEQEDSSTTRRYGGTGLGLAICRRLVEHMSGQIGVISHPNQGSTFWFQVQLAKQTAQPSVAPPTELPVQLGRVLVVDDNETNRKILRYQLRSWNVQYQSSAASGPEALAMLREAASARTPFDLVILDMMMPDMDGLAVAREIKMDPILERTRLVMLTSVCQRINSAEMQTAGIFAYLVKPVKPAQLYQCLTRVLAEDLGSQVHRPAPKHPVLDQSSISKISLKLLLVEDNIVNQRVALKQLGKLGHTIDVAANGLEALEAVRRIAYDAIIMDCIMPEMDGFEAARRIRAMEHAAAPVKTPVPIIAMTANAMQGDREKCLAAGMDDYVSKPVGINELQVALSKCIPSNQT